MIYIPRSSFAYITAAAEILMGFKKLVYMYIFYFYNKMVFFVNLVNFT